MTQRHQLFAYLLAALKIRLYRKPPACAWRDHDKPAACPTGTFPGAGASPRDGVAVLFLSLLLACPAASAQTAPPLTWQALSGPGGYVSHVAAADGGHLYAVSVGGVDRRDDQSQWRAGGRLYRSDALYHSQDGGATWQPLTNDLIPGPITTVFADPITGDLYVGLQGAGDSFTRRYGLWRSQDQGRHWAQVAFDRNDLSVLRIVRSADGRRLYLGVTEAVKYPSSYIYRSDDDGRTWLSFQALRYEQRPGSILQDLVAHPKDPNRLFITTYGSELFVSEDGGETFALPGKPENPPLPDVTGPARLVFSPAEPEQALFVRGFRQDATAGPVIERTSDSGATWARVTATGLPGRTTARALIALPGNVFLLNTGAATYRSADGGLTWRPLEGPLGSGSVSEFLLTPDTAAPTGKVVVAATGFGLFASRDGGALWQGLGAGLPFNGRIASLLTDPRQPDRVLALTDDRFSWPGRAPMVLRSADRGRTWAPASQGLPGVTPTAWALAPADPNTIYISSYEHFFRSTDGGLSWLIKPLPLSGRGAIAVAPSDPARIYLGGQPGWRSTDGGATWAEMPVALPGQERQTNDATGLAVDPADPDHLWAGLDGGGVAESRDGGRTWQPAGLTGDAERRVRWLVADAADGFRLYAGVTEGGLYRWDGPGTTWQAATKGLPEGSTLLALVPDPRSPGTLWAARDGGGVYRSSDRGASWSNVSVGMGDNLALTLALDHRTPDGMLVGTATAGVWALRPQSAPAAKAPTAIDARIEIVWPHDGAAVTDAKRANIGLRLFQPTSLLPPTCGWSPKVTVWQAVDTAPAGPLGEAQQGTVVGLPFPFWELNDVDVTRANDPAHKLYFMVRVAGSEAATAIWAHGSDPRTYYPQPEVPSGLATAPIDALDTLIQVVWPHDETGAEQPVSEADYINIAVALFKHGTRLSTPVGWQPAGLTLFGAWNQEIGRPLAREATAQTRRAGAITYPVWEFNNIPVGRAADPANKLYLWVMAEGIESYPTIWAHGADARTFFPTKDEPVQGCVP